MRLFPSALSRRNENTFFALVHFTRFRIIRSRSVKMTKNIPLSTTKTVFRRGAPTTSMSLNSIARRSMTSSLTLKTILGASPLATSRRLSSDSSSATIDTKRDISDILEEALQVLDDDDEIFTDNGSSQRSSGSCFPSSV